MNALRMTGLASGMDTQSMVDSLMRAERMKYDKLTQQKTLLDWKKEANLEVNNLLRSFRDDYFSVLKPDNNMLSSTAIQLYKVQMDANPSVSVSAGRDALTGSHTIDSIASLASGAKASSTAPVSAGALSLDAELGSLALNTPLTFVDGALSFTINGSDFTFNSTDSLRTVINRVNSDATANVQMSYSSLTGKISVANKALGSAHSLVITNGSGNAFAASGAAFGVAENTFTNGTDASLTIDGVAVVKETNNFTIDGVTYSLKGTTGSPVSFSVDQDVDAAVGKIKKFVDAYNTLIGKLEDTVDEKPNPDYKPLTDTDRENLSEAQIEKWEKLAKSGMLHNDSYVNRLLQDMRKSFYDVVSGAGVSASSIGLTTSSYLTKGIIQIDETKLRKALQDNPQQVADVFSKASYASGVSQKYSESGLAARMQTSINSYITDYMGYRTQSTNSQYSRLADSMTRMQQTLSAKEERYWQQFSRMEQAISQMNSQSSWLSQQFAAKG